MKVCNNCGSRLSCGCQRRTAKDGKACCNGCVHGYNASIKIKQQTNNINTAPSNVMSTYNGPGMQI
jgi:hypothetical protein